MFCLTYPTPPYLPARYRTGQSQTDWSMHHNSHELFGAASPSGGSANSVITPGAAGEDKIPASTSTSTSAKLLGAAGVAVDTSADGFADICQRRTSSRESCPRSSAPAYVTRWERLVV